MRINRRSFLGKLVGIVLSTTLISDLEVLEVSEPWSSFAFPLIRNPAPVFAADLVSVQPMNLPSNMVFFMDFKYGEGGYE